MVQSLGVFLLVAGLLVVSANQSAAQTVTRFDNGYLVQFEETINLAGSVSSLVITAFPGDIDIVRSNGREIIFQESIQLRADDADEARNDARRIAATVEENRSSIEIRGRGDDEQGRRLKLTVPAHLMIKAASSYGDITLDGGTSPAELRSGSGNIYVSSLDAYVDITTGSGDVEVIDVAGPLTIESGAGDVTIDHVDAEIYIVTGAGDMEISDVAGAVTGTTGGGNIEGDRIEGEVKLYTAGGDIELIYVEGELDLNTSGGSIELEDVIGDVRAVTSGGDIEVEQLRGMLNAQTMAGDIEVFNMSGSIKVVSKVGDVIVQINSSDQREFEYIDLRAENGDVELLLPRGFNADLRVDIGHDGQLDTDRVRGDLEWTQIRRAPGNGQIRRAVGTMNSGGIPIELSSGSGNVTISDRSK